jgi:hypothetical protein
VEWIKSGLINIVGKIEWSKSHAQVPTVLLLKDRVRVYFATRPKPGLSMTTFCDLDINDLNQVLYIHNKPVLDLGGPGTFDEYGIMPSSIIAKQECIFLYYSGWSRSVGVPYKNYTGLAISEDGGLTFRKAYKGPILDRTKFEIYSATSPEVYFDGNWHMWYCSGTNWLKIEDKYEHTYDIKYAHSNNGIEWNRDCKISIKQKNEFEAITKPSVIVLNKKYHMWYCFRGSIDFRSGPGAYRIGYAISDNLEDWERRDNEAGISRSDYGWDSEMIAYPAILKLGEDYYMFYNGNSFGKDGFGLAKLKF